MHFKLYKQIFSPHSPVEELLESESLDELSLLLLLSLELLSLLLLLLLLLLDELSDPSPFCCTGATIAVGFG